MASIYLQATVVLVWLGLEECGSAFRTHEDISSRCSDAYDQVKHVSDDVGHPNTDWGFRDHVQLSEFDSTDQATHELKTMLRGCNIEALGKLFAAAWFVRVWSIQEFIMARKIEIFMGLEGTISYEAFTSAIYTLKRYENFLPKK
jgi:hypothetical protein